MSARWVFLPVLGAPVVHGPVLRFDLLASWRRPIDGGRSFRGHRIFGDHKTWRGAACVSAGVLAGTLTLFRIPAYRARLPPEVRDAGPLAVGTLLGIAVVAGELPNSFAKRRLGIAPGTQRRSAAGAAISVFDQADFVLAAWLLLRPIWAMSATEAAEVFAIVATVHLPINLAGRALGVRASAL